MPWLELASQASPPPSQAPSEGQSVSNRLGGQVQPSFSALSNN